MKYLTFALAKGRLAKTAMEMFEKSALELVVSVSRCLVADSVREVVRAFVGYFQTITGIKATNVIAIGSPASGKSFILERALAMMPQEYIHYGVMTESAFFESFDGQNLEIRAGSTIPEEGGITEREIRLLRGRREPEREQ